MMIETKEIYSEVYSILNMLGENYINKMPKGLYEMIKYSKSMTYKPEYNAEISLNAQDVKKETLSMIALFHLNYWCNTEQEKEALKQIFKQNEEKYQKELHEKYDIEKVLNQRKLKNDKTQKQEKLKIIEYKESIFTKLINKIKRLLKINTKP